MKYRVMMIVLSIVFVISLSSCFNPFSASSEEASLDSWIGKYEYSVSLPPLFEGGIGLYEGYTILIYKENEEYLADITADGWMLGIRASATVRGNEDTVTLSFLEGESTYTFENGEEILSFTRDGKGIITKWIGISHLEANKGAEGVYFEKVE